MSLVPNDMLRMRSDYPGDRCSLGGCDHAAAQIRELVETLRSVEKALKPWGRPLTDGGRWPVNMLEKTYQQVDAVLAKHKG